MTRPISIFASILIAASAALTISCSATAPGSGGGGAGASIFSIGSGNAPAGADGSSEESAPVMDVGNPEEDQATAPYIDDSRLRRYYNVKEHGFRIAYPAGWKVTRDERTGFVAFDSPDFSQRISASWLVFDGSFEYFVEDVQDQRIELEPTTAYGFDDSLMGMRPDGDFFHFEAYAGKAAEDKTLIVILTGSVDIKSQWQGNNTISTIPEGGSGRSSALRAPTTDSPKGTPKVDLDEGTTDYLRRHYR